MNGSKWLNYFSVPLFSVNVHTYVPLFSVNVPTYVPLLSVNVTTYVPFCKCTYLCALVFY